MAGGRVSRGLCFLSVSPINGHSNQLFSPASCIASCFYQRPQSSRRENLQHPAPQYLGLPSYSQLLALKNWLALPAVVVVVAQARPALCDPMDCSPPGSSVHGILPARILKWVAMPFSRGSSQSRSPTLQEDSLLSEPPGKPKNTGVGSLSFLQGIFPTPRNQSGVSCIVGGLFTS